MLRFALIVHERRCSMNEKIPYTKTMTTAELSDSIFATVYNMPTAESALKRAAHLCSASSL